MTNYRVRWEIDIDDVDSPEEAAVCALAIQRDNDPANSATCFEVCERIDRIGLALRVFGPEVSIDLSEEQPQADLDPYVSGDDVELSPEVAAQMRADRERDDLAARDAQATQRRQNTVIIELVSAQRDEGKWVGSFPFVQCTYGDVRVGTEGERTLLHFRDGWWVDEDGKQWSDFIVSPEQSEGE